MRADSRRRDRAGPRPPRRRSRPRRRPGRRRPGAARVRSRGPRRRRRRGALRSARGDSCTRTGPSGHARRSSAQDKSAHPARGNPRRAPPGTPSPRPAGQGLASLSLKDWSPRPSSRPKNS
ncbi:hypothetical protein F1D61_29785 [Methylobacterium aquaticum]|nr:hypothetical protein F1D61_29785 [Methylobacterium aquaticum]